MRWWKHQPYHSKQGWSNFERMAFANILCRLQFCARIGRRLFMHFPWWKGGERERKRRPEVYKFYFMHAKSVSALEAELEWILDVRIWTIYPHRRRWNLCIPAWNVNFLGKLQTPLQYYCTQGPPDFNVQTVYPTVSVNCRISCI